MASEQPKSTKRISFDANVRAQNWKDAFRDFNALNMYEMLRAYRDLDTATRSLFWGQRNRTTGGGGNPSIPITQPGEIPRMQYAVTVVDTGQMPDGDPPGDLRPTGQEEDARELIAPVPDKLARFTFDSLKTAYPAGSPSAAKSLIGGKVNADWITNTCAIRISRVLNYNAVPIPGPNAKVLDVVSGADSRWYAYRQKPLQDWFRSNFGSPSLELPKPANRRKLQNLQGFIGFDIHFADATGHFDLWFGDRFGTEAEATHDYFALANKVVFWRVRGWTGP
jgi:hypothetical protein